ncbi:glutaredoxin family protein [Mycolicibacterium moriokaense]|uniref:Glutaredoxin n=1 Tax=Mycolicibacterium moriokaense TaxID=39691 RepID=A0A318HCU0_9MYCO|nr:glutaredoxin family protein [Mycolicibacterium moriokaense]PXX06343.1 glutaredoxin [Mycolicibacterium moriokaense]
MSPLPDRLLTPRVTVYTKPACPQCRATLRALENAGLDYETIDISTDAQARDFVMSLGHVFSVGFATVSMADQRIVGGPDAARCACGVRSPPHSSR